MGNLASDPDKLQDDGVGDMSSKDFYESDGFSDIDDAEVRTKESNNLFFS
jgi:transcription factor IIIB subunit 2